VLVELGSGLEFIVVNNLASYFAVLQLGSVAQMSFKWFVPTCPPDNRRGSDGVYWSGGCPPVVNWGCRLTQVDLCDGR